MSATLTTEQAAAFLQVHKSTVLAMARSGALVGAKIGREWRFTQSSIEEALCPSTDKKGPTLRSTVKKLSIKRTCWTSSALADYGF